MGGVARSPWFARSSAGGRVGEPPRGARRRGVQPPPARASTLVAIAIAIAAAGAGCATPRPRAPPAPEPGSDGAPAAPRVDRPEAAAPGTGEARRPVAPRAPEPEREREPEREGGANRREHRPETPASVREAVAAAASKDAGPARGTPRALRAIAGLLASSARGVSAAAGPIARMHEEVDALEGLPTIDLDRADRVKAALDAGVEAVRALSLAGARCLEDWVGGAAAAAARVDPATPLGLQRAGVQDALRALADAVLVASQFATGGDGEACRAGPAATRAPRPRPEAVGRGLRSELGDPR